MNCPSSQEGADLMLVTLFSRQCFHCLEIDEFFGTDQVSRRADSLYGTCCPLCTRTIQHGDITIIMDKDDGDKIADGSVTWDKHGVQPRGFEGFLKDASGQRPSSGTAARLRAQVSGGPSKRRVGWCEAATTALVGTVSTDLVLKCAIEAEEQGDHARELRAYQAFVDYAETVEDRKTAQDIRRGVTERQESATGEAARLFRVAAGNTDSKLRTAAGYLLGRLLESAGKTKGAKHAFRECVKGGDGYARAKAADKLGELVHGRSPKKARHFYTIAFKGGDPELSARAALSLGMLDFQELDVLQGLRHWEYAFSNGDKDARTIAAFNLGMAWSLDPSSSSRVERAREYYKIALESPQPQVAEMAQDRLDQLR